MTLTSGTRLGPYAIALVGFLVLFLPLNSDVGVAGHRTQWRGSNEQQESAGKGVFETGGFGLEIVWTKSLGSGHSRITVVEGRAITMFSDGEFDNLVALEVATGEEIWRYRIATTYRGHDGSADGPHSTPIVDGGVAYGLGPKGHLFAVSFVDGAEIWSRKIDEELGARAPYWGFATTPAIEGEMLIVQTGGPEGRAIAGFDKRTGEVRWTVGNDTVGYQSPTVLTLAGVRQVVAVGNQEIMGILPRTGEVLWTYRYSTRGTEGSSRPLPLGKDKFLLRFMREGEGPGDAALYRVEGTDEEGFTVTEIWRTTAFKGSFSAPVFYGGHLYGYNGSFLTCVDAATGKEVWKSRPPGGRTLGLADDHLLILAPRGVVVAVEATPAGYKEKARVRALDRRSFTSPTFTDDSILVRDFTHIVSLRVTEPAAVAAPTAAEPEPALAASEFAAFVRKVEVARDKEVLFDEFMGNQDQFPILEGDHRVHFVYRGEEQRVGVKGNMLDDFGFPDPMHRIDGTDFHHRSYALEPGSRWEYQFVLNMDEMNEEHVTDPFNPRI